MPPQTSLKTTRPLRWTLSIAAVILLCAALACALASLVPFANMRSFAISSIPANYSDRFTPNLYRRFILSVRLLAVALAVCTIAIAVFVQPLERALAAAARNLKILGIAILSALSRFSRDRPLHRLAFALILGWAIFLRLLFLGEPIRYDEAYTFMCYVSRPIFVGLAYYTANNHLLNTLLAHLATSILGDASWVTRLPVFIAGVLLVPVTYAAVRLFTGKDAALLAAALVSSSSPLIEYSFNARGYGLGALLFVAAIALIGLLLRGLSGAWILLPLTAALCLYSVPTMVYGVVGIYFYLLLWRRRDLRHTIAAIFATAALTLLLYAPVLLTFGPAAITGNRWVVPVPRYELGSDSLRELWSLWWYWNLDVPVLLSALILVAALTPLLLRGLRRSSPFAPIFLLVAAAATALISIQLVVPPRRIWLFLLPVYFASAATGVNLFISRARFHELAALLLAAVMGGSVLAHKSLRHDGIEATGLRSAGAIVLAARPFLEHGAQFICIENSDAGLAYVMRSQNIRYHPSASGDLLILAKKNQTPQDTLQQVGLPTQVVGLHQVGSFEDANLYAARRAPQVPFALTLNDREGPFTFLPH